MFSSCSSLTSLNLSNFNTNNVKYMSYMFSHCSSLTSLNLSNFNTNNVKDMSYMLSGLNKNCKIETIDKKIRDIIF
jgi:surface protein